MKKTRRFDVQAAKDLLLGIFYMDKADSEGLYDVDMFVFAVEHAPEWNNFRLDFESQVNFLCGLMEFVRAPDPYEWFGAAGLSIITAELMDWAHRLTREA